MSAYHSLLQELAKTKAVLEECLTKAQAGDHADAPFPLDHAEAKIWHEARISAFRHALEMLPIMDEPIVGLSTADEPAARYQHAAKFAARWAWRADPPNANFVITDSERLSVIKYHPTIRRLAEQQVNADAAKQFNWQLELFHILATWQAGAVPVEIETDGEPTDSTLGWATIRNCLMRVDEHGQIIFTLTPEMGFDGITYAEALAQAKHYVSLHSVFSSLVYWEEKHNSQNVQQELVYTPSYAALGDYED